MWYSHLRVEVRFHQDEHSPFNLVQLSNDGHNFEECAAVIVIDEQTPSIGCASHCMVNSAWIADSRRSGHAGDVLQHLSPDAFVEFRRVSEDCLQRR
jgi:hypothetical protein